MSISFKKDTKVFTADGQQVGTIDQVVIDPSDKSTTHVIVRKGTLSTERKVMPIEMIAETHPDRVILRDNAEIDTFTDFQERHFIAADGEELPATFTAEHAQPVYWYPFGSVEVYRRYASASRMPYYTAVDRRMPEQARKLTQGVKVISADGIHVGNIERVYVDPDSGHVMTFLVSESVILKNKTFIPSAWISKFSKGEVQLAVGSLLLEKHSRLLETWQELQELADRLSSS